MLIKDVCKKTGFNSSAIRYYDSQGLLGEVQRKSNNYRVFNENDVEQLNFIRKARALGFELEEIKKIFELKDNGIQPCDYVSQRIQNKITAIQIEIERLEKEKALLKKNLVEAKKVIGCQGKVCHYIEGVEDDKTSAKDKEECI